MNKILPAGVKRGAEVVKAMLDASREEDALNWLMNNVEELEALVEYILEE